MKRLAFTCQNIDYVPDFIRNRVNIDGNWTRGIAEFKFPKGFWELFISKSGETIRLTSHPNWKPKRYGRFYNHRGFDFDTKRLQPPVISALIRATQQEYSIYWRPSSTLKGIHLLVDKSDQSLINLLSTYNDQTREKYTKLRGYEWFWESKAKSGDRPERAHKFFRNKQGKLYVHTKYFRWKKLTKIDCMRLSQFESRIFRRKRSRKKRNKY